MNIGVISDTHGYIDPQALERLAGADRILHAGDIGSDEVLAALERLAPVTAVAGNIDRGAGRAPLRSIEILDWAGRRIVMTHQRPPWDALRVWCSDRMPDVVVSGHSHRPLAKRVSGVLFLNPGSAGRKRVNLPRSCAILRLGESVSAEILFLEDE